MIEGISGILSSMKNDNPCVYEPGRQRVVWKNGTIGKLFTAEKPNRLRGPQHHWGWADEIAAWQYPQEAWDMMMLGLRVGDMPQACVTTTPKPIKLIIDLFNEATEGFKLREALDGAPLLAQKLPTVIDVSTSYENRANLSESWYDRTIKAYEGTSLYDQEVLAHILTDIQGALWKMALIESTRIRLDPVTLEVPPLPDFNRIVIAVDPAVTSSQHSNETGIMVCARGVNGHGYLLGDFSGRWTPNEWASRAVREFHERKADRIVAEQNQGGEMVKATIHTVDPNVSVKLVTATRGKIVRAEPIAAKYEQGKIHHVGTFGALEAQMTTWTPDSGLESPDRFDALVWGMTELLLGRQGAFVV
jgi:phage terminase large subunit-like protein